MGKLTERLLKATHEENCCCEECKCEEHKENLSEEEIERIINEKYSEKDDKTKKFIRRSLRKYGETYTYYNSVFIDYGKTKIKICCPIHGEFEKTAARFLGVEIGCPVCSILAGKEKLKFTTEMFIEKARKIHGDKFDYSKTVYKSNTEPVIIICKEHGEFETTPHSHFHTKGGCPKCAIINSTSHNKKGKRNLLLSTEGFIEKARKVHGDKYDYSLVDCKGYKKPVKIICKEHGVFEQKPNTHLAGGGCPECAKRTIAEKLRLTTEDFIRRAREVHGDKYDYSNVKYHKGNEKVEIICPIHGSFFQKPNSHLSGQGCPICGKNLIKSLEGFIKDANLVHGVGTYDYSEVDYKGSEVPIKIFDPLYNEFFYITPHSHLKGYGNPSRSMSSGERLVYTWLTASNINFQTQFSIGKENFIEDFGVRIDFRIEDYNGEVIFIEYNGEQHYNMRSILYKDNEEKFQRQLKRDKSLREFCKMNSIRLIEIPYTIHTYNRISDFLTKTIIEGIDPHMLIDYDALYVVEDNNST